MSTPLKKVLFAYDFPTDSARVHASSEDGGMVAAALQNQQPSRKWRSVGTYATVDFCFPIPQSANFFFIYGHNLTPLATIKIVTADDEFFQSVVDTSEIALIDYQDVLGFGLEPFGICSFGSTEPCSEIPGAVKQMSEFLSPSRATKCVRFIINDPTNPDGYIQAGRLGLGNYWQPRFNVSFGYAAGRVLNTKTVTTISGATRGRRRTQHRAIELELNYLDAGEESVLQSMISVVDAVKNVYFSAYPHLSPSTESKQHSGLFFIDEVGLPVRVDAHHRSLTMRLKEAI